MSLEHSNNHSSEERYIAADMSACRDYYNHIRTSIDTRSVNVDSIDTEHSINEYAILSTITGMLRKQFYSYVPGLASTMQLPVYDLYQTDKRQAIEQFKLLPLKEFGPTVDEIFPVDDARAWYELTVGQLVSGDEFHGLSCHTMVRRDTPLSCRHSVECPRKILKYTLVGPSLDEDFSELGYIINPERHDQLVEMKLNVAAGMGVEDPLVASAALAQYRRNVTRDIRRT